MSLMSPKMHNACHLQELRKERAEFDEERKQLRLGLSCRSHV